MSANTSLSSSDGDEEIVCKRSGTQKFNSWPSDSETESEVQSDSSCEAECTLVPSSSSSSVQTACRLGKSSFEAFEKKLSGMVAEHKSCLKKLRQEERANNEEFFALITYRKTGELPSSDNTTVYLPVIHEGINLMQIPAGHSAAKFGRHLGCAMYGKGDQCMLQNLMIGSHRRRKDTRTPVPEEERAKFELVVRRKYPKFPEAAYKDARHAANQMGLDIKLKVLKGNAIQ